ncbi:MAG TPA: aminoglycoside phosphotransferase family protein [Streptosporangiaceae bacterium]
MERVSWQDLPEAVRTWAQDVLGAPVTGAVSQSEGFSPGAAARLTLADGRRAFVKAVSSAANPHSPDLHRREAQVTAALPAGAGVPQLLGSYDDGTWVALLLTDVDGRHPAQPWQLPDLGRVISALDGLHGRLTPAPDGFPPVAQQHAAAFTGWRQLAAADRGELAVGRGGLDDWSARNLAGLAELESRWADAAAGDTLLHCDVRADNVLLSDAGVVFVDWPWACVGAPWIDLVLFAPSVTMQGGPQPEWVLASSRTGAAADAEPVAAVVAAMAGFLTWQALQPAPPGLPGLRAFQRAQGKPARAWLRRLTGWS